MIKTGWQNPWVRIVTTLLSVAVMVMIFCFSMETAEQSDQTSGSISREVVRIVHPDYDKLEPVRQKSIFDTIQHIVRKCAHFTEYMILGFVIRLCLESWFGHKMRRNRSLAISGAAVAILYACTDEIHQLSIDGRSGQWTDVLVDSSGVLIGVTLGTLLIKALNGKMQTKKGNSER